MESECTTAADVKSAPAPGFAGDATCISCDYSLRGLAETGMCPECGTPVADSLQFGPLGFLNLRDAGSLVRGIKLLKWSVRLTIANFVCLVLALITGSALAGVLLLCALATSLTALLGWTCVALIGADGAGAGAGWLRRLLIVMAMVMSAAMVAPVIAWVTGGMFSFAVAPSIAAMLIASPLLLVIGQLRLVSLARRGGHGTLVDDGRGATRLLASWTALWIVSLMLIPFVLVVSAAVLLPIGLFLLVAGIVLWYRFLSGMLEAAERRMISPVSDGIPG